MTWRDVKRIADATPNDLVPVRYMFSAWLAINFKITSLLTTIALRELALDERALVNAMSLSIIRMLYEFILSVPDAIAAVLNVRVGGAIMNILNDILRRVLRGSS